MSPGSTGTLPPLSVAYLSGRSLRSSGLSYLLWPLGHIELHCEWLAISQLRCTSTWPGLTGRVRKSDQPASSQLRSTASQSHGKRSRLVCQSVLSRSDGIGYVRQDHLAPCGSSLTQLLPLHIVHGFRDLPNTQGCPNCLILTSLSSTPAAIISKFFIPIPSLI